MFFCCDTYPQLVTVTFIDTSIRSLHLKNVSSWPQTILSHPLKSINLFTCGAHLFKNPLGFLVYRHDKKIKVGKWWRFKEKLVRKEVGMDISFNKKMLRRGKVSKIYFLRALNIKIHFLISWKWIAYRFINFFFIRLGNVLSHLCS